MKRHFSIPITIMILAGVLTVGAQAQTANAQRVIADIPFTFDVGKKTLPAGKYTITVLNPSSDQKILQLRSMNGRSSAIILTTGVIGTIADNAKVVFHRYDNRYVFAQAQMAGDSTSLAAVKSNAERNEKQVVAISAAPRR